MSEQILITINTGNAAFEDSPATEIARILHKLAGTIEQWGWPQFSTLYDINGNSVGMVKIEKAVQS